MNAGVWGAVIAAALALAGALTAYLKSRTVQSQVATHIELHSRSNTPPTNTPPPAA